MFQSLNLFKAITCPYVQTNNSQICDRPHCQFKHHASTLTTPTAIQSKQVSNVQSNDHTDSNLKS
jgi:hypothetical protein